MSTPTTDIALPPIEAPTAEQLAELAGKPPEQRAAVVLRSSAIEPVLLQMAAALADIDAIKDSPGREQVHRGMMNLKRARTTLQSAGKEARDDANAFARAVIDEEKRLVGIIQPEEERLATLRNEWDAERQRELDELKAKEQARKDAHEAAIAAIQQQPARLLGSSAEAISEVLAGALEHAKSPNLAEEQEEYRERYQSAHLARVALLENMLERQRFIESEEERIAEEGRKLAEARREAEEKAEQQRQAEERRRAEEDRAAEQARQKADQEAADKRAEEKRAHDERIRLENEELEARQAQEAEQRRQREAEALAKAEAERAEQARKRAKEEELERLADEEEKKQAAERIDEAREKRAGMVEYLQLVVDGGKDVPTPEKLGIWLKAHANDLLAIVRGEA